MDARRCRARCPRARRRTIATDDRASGTDARAGSRIDGVHRTATSTHEVEVAAVGEGAPVAVTARGGGAPSTALTQVSMTSRITTEGSGFHWPLAPADWLPNVPSRGEETPFSQLSSGCDSLDDRRRKAGQSAVLVVVVGAVPIAVGIPLPGNVYVCRRSGRIDEQRQMS